MADRDRARSAREELLGYRAARAGYRLARDTPTPYLWQLRDVEDDTVIQTAETLDGIEQWLDQ